MISEGKDLVEFDQARIDKAIWENIGIKSVREIADLTGLKPEEVLRRKTDLLEGIDVLTIAEKETRILVELEGMARDMRARAANTIDEYASGMINSSVAALKTMLSQLDRLKKQDQGKIEALNALRVKELLRLVDLTTTRAVREIAATHDLEETELMEVFQGHLVDAAREIENE